MSQPPATERQVKIEALALHQDDPLGADLALVALELSRGADGPLDVSAAGVGGHGREQERVFVDRALEG